MASVLLSRAPRGPWPASFQADEVAELRGAGFEVLEVESEARVLEAIRAVAAMGGKVDCLVMLETLTLPDSPTLAVVDAIRSLSPEILFKSQVRAATTPIIVLQIYLAHDEMVPPWKWVRTAWSALKTARSPVVDAVTGVIAEWRADLLRELDHVGFAVTVDGAGKFTVSHALVRSVREGEILAEGASPTTLRKSQYYILAPDVLDQSAVLHKLAFLLDHYEALAKRARTKPEELFQRFFEQHPHLIYRGTFGAHWAKPRLPVQHRARVLIPDFVLKPRAGSWLGNNWEILELKLPDAPLLERAQFHRSLSTALLKAIGQLRDYRELFNRPDASDRLLRLFGAVPRNPSLAVLIGRRPKESEATTLAVARGTMATLDVGLITYDEIISGERLRLDAELRLLQE